MEDFHLPVLLNETIRELRVKRNGLYIDATVGGGGHAGEILRLGGKVLAIDQDHDALLHIEKKFEKEIKLGSLILARGNFAEIETIAKRHRFNEVDGVLLDLGVSSYQLDKSKRGFSFRFDEPLDMRMSSEGISAYDVVNKLSEEALYDIISKYGEEKNARKIAENIVNTRKNAEIKTTQQLTDIVSSVVRRSGDTHPATKTFQAIRIYVNDELNVLRIALNYGFKLLKKDGVIVVISFHSLEDRIVKLFGARVARENRGLVITKKPIVASWDEIQKNRRARSAKLRVIQKTNS